MDIKKILLISLIIVAIVASVSAVSAGWFDLNDDTADDIKTHEFNYVDMVSFNISDDLTNNTEVNKILFGAGVSYKSPENDKGEYAVVGFEGVGDSVSDPIESKENDAYTEEIEKNQTSQGYDAYIFQWADSDMCDVYIDLDNMTIVDYDGLEEQFPYFHGTFRTLDEAHIFIETFKVNEDAINKGV